MNLGNFVSFVKPRIKPREATLEAQTQPLHYADSS